MTPIPDSHPANKSIQRVVVLGGGTAGFLSALALKKSLPDKEIVVVRSTKMGVIGVGEGTIPSVLHFLHNYLNIGKFEIFRKVHASPKLGIKYLWGKRPFFNYTFSGQLTSSKGNLSLPRGYYCRENFDFADLNSAMMFYDTMGIRNPKGGPVFNKQHAYHLENKRFVEFMEELADKAGIVKVDAIVLDAIENESGVEAVILEGGQRVEGDFFVDCSGFSSIIMDKVLKEERVDFSDALFCDRAVVGGWDRENEVYHPYTTAETMNAGWCWQIEHDHLINRGYVYCSGFISDEKAVEEFKTKNPKIKDVRVIRFDSNVVKRSWVKNVVAIGNSAGFVEPLEATSIGMICDAALRLSLALQIADGKINELQRRVFNRITLHNWLLIRDFLALHYKFNNRLETPFWKTAMNEVNIGATQEYVEYYKAIGPDLEIFKAEMSRDFFTSEGYLSMLVGQRVPYVKSKPISEAESEKWKGFRQKLGVAASMGLSVQEFLKIARSDNPYQRFGISKNARRNATKSGQLNWH